MSTSSTATLPRNGGNGRGLLSIFGENFRAMLAARNTRAPHTAPAEDMSIWQLYRLTVGYDSISPAVAAELRKKLVGN
jgi:hypothetical protein